MVCDYRALNEVTAAYAHNLPILEATLENQTRHVFCLRSLAFPGGSIELPFGKKTVPFHVRCEFFFRGAGYFIG